jgi:hypothetical protein
LLVTALIAVGAKLWHGPHHAAEKLNGLDHEYDYYRGFGWERIVHGVAIERNTIMFDKYEMPLITISYFRHGVYTMNMVELTGYDPSHHLANQVYRSGSPKVDLSIDLLNATEKKQMEDAVISERVRMKKAGYHPHELLRQYQDELRANQ